MSSQTSPRPGGEIDVLSMLDGERLGDNARALAGSTPALDAVVVDTGSDGEAPDAGAAGDIPGVRQGGATSPSPAAPPAASSEAPREPELMPPEAAGRAPHGPSISSLVPRLGSLSRPLSPVLDESARWGRDDLKHREAGSQGVASVVGVGSALAHMVGLGDEDPGRRNGEKLSSSDNEPFVGEELGVGSGLDHLWLLGDVEYTRASVDNPDDDVFTPRDARAPSYGPLSEKAMSFSGREDGALRGRIFDPAVAALPVSQRSISVDPASGTAVFNADGTFEFTPSNGFSGVATLSFELTDPRTGLKETGVITVVVAAVADPATISGAATTPEDTRVATPITVTLNDADGSETIERVVISRLPSGASLQWNTTLPGNVATGPSGIVVTGTTKQIQDLLASLSVTPPADFHGRITLGVDVTTVESHVSPSLPGYMDRLTTHYDYKIDVVAVADPVTATGATKTTDEDVAVHLSTLAATFGDLTDGSETHTVEIRGVDADAKLQTASGVEYAFTTAADGTKTYVLTPAQVGAVYFLPPPDASGLFSGMTIVAIAREGSNGSTETASAPISVLVNPVADPLEVTAPAQSTNEDTPVTFGDDIAITVMDPATQTVTSVVVSGFPPGTTITYTPVGAAAPITVIAGVGTTVELNGGTEAQIRAALATLTLTPQQHSDANITLSIAATTEDLGGVTDTRVVSMPISVAAVADGPSISGSAAGDEDQPIALPITVSRIDADGSESYDFAAFTIPAGVTFTYPGVLPNGITVSVSGTTYTFRPGAATTAGQFEAFLATGLQVQAPADSDVNFGVTVRIGTIESTLSGGEVALLRAEQTLVVPVSVRPVVDMPTISGSSPVDEDTSVGFGARIAISQNDKADGSEAITQIVLGNIPAAATVSYAAQGGSSVAVTTVAGVRSYTISGGSEDDIRATLATFALQPPQHSDQNISVSVAVTKTDRTLADPEAASTATVTATHVIAVAAVADGPTISGSASGTEDQPIALPVSVSRIDADGSESYDFARFTIPAGVTFIYPGVLPYSITVSTSGNVTTFRPGVATSAAQFEAFLASGLSVQAPADSDVNFNVGVRVGTIESVLSGGELTLLRADASHTIPVTVHPVIDSPVFSGSSSINEDGILDVTDQSVTAAVNFGANISISAPDSSDGSERITRIVVSGLPIGAVVSYTPISGVPTSFTVTAGSTSITLGGSGESEAAIRAALATLSLVPPAHSDADIALGIAVTKTDATASEGEATVSATFNGTHVIRVAAVADVPTASGSASGLEDQDIPVAITIGHADSTDGSEKIKDVVISGVPAGLTLTESSSGPGVLTFDAGTQRYTVTGPNDAAIQDVLARLTLVFVPGGARQHVDSDFSLSVTVTSIESSPSEAGGGQVALAEAARTILVPVTVTAVVDGITKSGASVRVEDVAKTIGGDIEWSYIDADGSEVVTTVAISGFPAGANVSYTDMAGALQSFVATGAETITLSGPFVSATGTAIRAALDTLNVRAPQNSDTNFTLSVAITTTDNDGSAMTQNLSHQVVVQAVADALALSVDALSLNEDTSASLVIRPDRSSDNDNSETLSLRITVPSDGAGVVGTLTASPPANVSFTAVGGGVYTVTAVGATPADREAALDAFLNGGISFTPRSQWSGVLTGTSGIRVDAISTEAATLYGNAVYAPDDELAPNNSAAAGTAGDLDTRTEITTRYIDVTVASVPDLPVMANASTIVKENNGSSAPSDPDLVIALGSRLGLTIADTDGSQGMSVTLSGLPLNLQDAVFGPPIVGVSTTIDLATGTVTLSGSKANDVLSLLATLSITLADDRDQNFDVIISGTSTDTNGVTGSSATFSLTHSVVVQAVADEPTVDVGAATKPAVLEDSGFVGYPVTVALNDLDGSETFQSVTVAYTTPGSGSAAQVRFDPAFAVDFAGVTFTAGTGSITLTGPTSQIAVALTHLQIAPGANNGEDISVTITAIAVESSPAEDNNGAAIGLGGGVAGPEIAVPTATTIASFTIPVTPDPEVPTLTAPSSASGLEDTSFGLGAISIGTGAPDPDGSEARFIEIDTGSFPGGTQFLSGATPTGSVVTPGWLRISEAVFATLAIRPPLNFSGTIDLSVRGVVTDTNAAGTVTTVTTAAQALAVSVGPVADPAAVPSRSIGYEDQVVGFGADLADASTGIRVTDAVVGSPTNGGAETLSRVSLTIPADTNALMYVMSGAYVPVASGTISGVGSAQVAYVAATRTYTITSTIITGAANVADLTDTERAQAEADIRSTLQSFNVRMDQDRNGDSVPDGDQDRNGAIAVSVTTLDVKNGLSSTTFTDFTHDVAIMARADTPSIAAGFSVSGAESAGSPSPIALLGPSGERIVVDRSSDTDGVADDAGWGSERLSVVVSGVPAGASIGASIALPAGATIVGTPGGDYRIEAANERDLNSILAALTITSPDFAGTATLTLTAITTEKGQAGDPNTGLGAGIDVLSATAIATVTLNIIPTVDAPQVKGNATGLEDTTIPVPMSVTLNDKDGSETFVSRIVAGVPAGAKIFGAGGAEILPAAGVYLLTPADVAALAIRPPLNYSSALSGHILMTVETVVTDTASTGTASATFTTTIPVEVVGVADKPAQNAIHVISDEDQPLAIGAAIITGAGGSLSGVLTDADTSERLSFVLTGVPSGVIPQSATPDGIIYLGKGSWQVSAAAVSTLTLPSVPNYSGENPYSGLTVRAVSQELDGSQATSDPWPITFSVTPVINAATVDGFASWSMGVTQTEAQNESPGAVVSLSSAKNHVFVDNDGSERAVSYTFDLSSLIANAGIAARLAALPGAGSGLDKLVAGYVAGTFTFDAAAGTITVLAADIDGIGLRASLFLDSNQDFSIPVSALVRDTAILGGVPTFSDKVETGTFAIDFIGTADIPTVFASSVTGASGVAMPLSLGGVSTDGDAALGRAGSEDIYYVVSLTNPGSAPALGFVDGSGNIVGLDNGDGTWVLTPADLAGLHVVTAGGSSGTANLRLTSIAVENDGDTASNSTTFSVTVATVSGTAGTPPLPPIVNVGVNAGNEDGSITLNVTAGPAPGDPSNPSVAVMISGLPAGAEVIGARYNPDTGRWVASAATVNSGGVHIVPPHDFSGSMPITVEAVATNGALMKASTGAITVPVAVDPVADGVAISANPEAGAEDTATLLRITLAERDVDGSEDIGATVYVRLDNGASLVGGYGVVANGAPDATIDGASLVGYYRVPLADVAGLRMMPANDWHGTVTASVAAYSIEPLDDNDGDNIRLSSKDFQISVAAIADPPSVTAPGVVHGTEDSQITLSDGFIGLSAALEDLVTTNGREVLSVTISGVPEGSMFSSGFNNGDGSWAFLPSDLAGLKITPPLNYSGTMSLTMSAIALELANGSEATTTVTFGVVVAPVADDVEILARNVTIGEAATASLDLNVRMADDNGTAPGENAPELIRMTLSSVPTGVSIIAGSGGTVTNPSAGIWQFVGTEQQSNALAPFAGPGSTAGTYTVALSAVTLDGASTLPTPVTDSFQIRVPQVMTGGTGNDTMNGGAGDQIVYGLGGADTINGGAGRDFIVGGAGADTLTGGSERDTFAWLGGELGTGVDTITDFHAGAGGDALDVSRLLTGFDPATSILSEFVQLQQAGGNTTVRIDADGGGNSFQTLAVLQGVTGFDAESLRANGNLIV